MKHVTFARAYPPYTQGSRLILPDDHAAGLEAEGAIFPNPPDWPESSAKPQARGPRKIAKPFLPLVEKGV